MQYKLKKTPDQVIEIAVEAVKLAAKKFSASSMVCRRCISLGPDFLVRIMNQVIEAGATVINIPDTVGYATPQEYGALFNYLKKM